MVLQWPGMRRGRSRLSPKGRSFDTLFRKACTGKLGRPAEAQTISRQPADGSPKTLTTGESLGPRTDINNG